MAEKKTMFIELDEKELEDLSIGDDVTVIVKAEVMALDAGEKPEKDDDDKECCFSGWPPDMKVKVLDIEISKGTNQFEALAKELDD